MDVVVERVAGLDLHKDTVVAGVRTPDEDGERVTEVRTFGTFTKQLLELRDWLLERGVTLVVMESTGVFWKPVYYVLEDAFECWVVNAQHMRNVPGRKTDVADAVWIAQLAEHGLVRPSFVPPPPIRELRSLTRYRRTLVEERTREVQRIDKVLQDAGLKLSSVASDLMGKSSRAMLDALIAGVRDPDALAELALRKLRVKIPQLREALTGRFTNAHALVLGQILEHIDFLDVSIARLSGRIDEVISPFVIERDLLTTIPGIDRRLAEAIIAETGVDMTIFGTPQRLSSWAGMCPGQYESAGKSRSGKARHGDTWLQRHLAVAAMAAARKNNCYLSARYRRLAKRRGKLKARKAVGRSILEACFYIMAGAVPYQEPGADFFDRLNSPQRRANRNLNELRALGWTLTQTGDEIICTPPQEPAA